MACLMAGALFMLSSWGVAMKQIGGTLLVVIVAGCRGTTAPTPAVSPPKGAVTVPTVTAPITISGVVAEGPRPIAGAEVDNGYGAETGTITDANGAFQLPVPGHSVDPMRWVRASKGGYAQPCAAPFGNLPMNVQIVSLSALTGDPLPSPDGLRTVSGVVVQVTNSGVQQPVANAWVDFEPDPAAVDDWPAAVTFSDAMGRFSLCALPMDAARIGATNDSRSSFAVVTVSPGQNNVSVILR
jgi:hypothetical protein